MSLASALPGAIREEGDIVEQPSVEYLWSDLKVRRNALSLWPEGLAPLLGLGLAGYLRQEAGGDDVVVDPRIVAELSAMEAFVAAETDKIVAAAPTEGTVILQAVIDQDLFNTCYPEARTQLLGAAYPVSLQHVAVGRAAAQLCRRDRDVEVYRGERHFDLTVSRLAVGLGKNETAHLLGLNVKTYYRFERGQIPPKPLQLDELQALDDFIVDTAATLEVSDADGVSVIWIGDDQAEFETTYPEARVQRSDTPYPVRMLHVAAGRRAHTIESAGQPVRIAIAD